MPISLDQVVSTWQDHWHFKEEGFTYPDIYLNRKTGEVFVFYEEDSYVEDDSFEPETMEELHVVKSSQDWIKMPSVSQLDEHQIMRDFCATLEDRAFAAELAGTICETATLMSFYFWTGKFKDVRERWGRYCDEKARHFIADWLAAQKIPFHNSAGTE